MKGICIASASKQEIYSYYFEICYDGNLFDTYSFLVFILFDMVHAAVRYYSVLFTNNYKNTFVIEQNIEQIINNSKVCYYICTFTNTEPPPLQ